MSRTGAAGPNRGDAAAPARTDRLPRRIVSGGQTGVDRAALDAAIAAGIPHGGWCPGGRRAEDGPIPARYRLRETLSPGYPARTRRNVLESDGTLILHVGPLTGGTRLTREMALGAGRPLLCVDLAGEADPRAIRRWLVEAAVRVLNVAGPRESQSPGIGRRARVLLDRVLTAPPAARTPA